MPSNRLETLKSLVAQDPANDFLRYGMAMEYVNGGEDEQAVAEFRAILERNPNYVAAYFHGGQALERAGDLDAARDLYQRGLDACTRVGDLKTRNEIQAALDILG